MNIQTVQLGDTHWKAVNGRLYPVDLSDEAIVALEALLARKSYVKVHIDYMLPPYEQDGYLCVNASTYKVGVSHQKGAKHAIEPLARTNIVNIVAEDKLIYVNSDGI